jgi:hypothetical protein
MHFAPLLQRVGSMFTDFRIEIANLRAEGATPADIDVMLDQFQSAYATDGGDEAILVIAVLREAAKPPSEAAVLTQSTRAHAPSCLPPSRSAQGVRSHRSWCGAAA